MADDADVNEVHTSGVWLLRTVVAEDDHGPRLIEIERCGRVMTVETKAEVLHLLVAIMAHLEIEKIES